MKKSIYFLIPVFFVFAVSIVYAQMSRRGAILSESEVQKRWGSDPFNAEKFKTGGDKVRASMAYSILKKKKEFLGKYSIDLKEQLGAPNGFYQFDVFPAYMIQTGNNKSEESWQIVFTLDEKRNVTDVFVHKNCCYK